MDWILREFSIRSEGLLDSRRASDALNYTQTKDCKYEQAPKEISRTHSRVRLNNGQDEPDCYTRHTPVILEKRGVQEVINIIDATDIHII